MTDEQIRKWKETGEELMEAAKRLCIYAVIILGSWALVFLVGVVLFNLGKSFLGAI
jgi:hypothetical protein